VRIPLDYYRILGLPIQAPAEQLKQAHDDRTHQMPRREYSENAIAARRALLDEAYTVLANPDDRAEYDQSFLATTSYDSELGEPARVDAEPTPHIDIADQHLVGALLILQELGEYELVLKVGRPYLSSGRLGSGSSSLKNGQFGDPNVALADTVLTIALACLDLGREHWQQGQHETAAEALETGEELLVREGLFAGIRSEIQSDLLRLRPYRVLELLALPDQQYPGDRKKGLSLLQDMLRERDGIDGAGDDQSGLSMDDFLRFVQQLRGYLTAEEQQILFEEEARRPSAVATYLAIYALIARGFAEHQPALIRRAKHLLAKLSTRQDVHLEQSVCALLLGQTEEANRLLELSQEYEPIAFIREHSQGSPDWLPGLCLYAERWLGGEVYPHFRDLSQHHVALKEYFADEQVQLYLEELPAEGVDSQVTPRISNLPTPSEDVWAEAPAAVTYGSSASNTSTVYRPETVAAIAAVGSTVGSTVSYAVDHAVDHKATFVEEEAERVERSTPRSAKSDKSSRKTKSKENSPSDREALLTAGAIGTVGATVAETSVKSEPKNTEDQLHPLVPSYPRRPTKPARRSAKRGGVPLWFPLALGCVGVMAMGFGITRLIRNRPAETTAVIAPTVIATPSTAPNQPIAVQGDLNEATAKQVLELWFTVKKAALGSGYAIDQLEQALIDPKLTQWKNEAKFAQRDGVHLEYEHALEVKKVEISPTNPNEAFVTANVRELRKVYEGSNLAKQDTDDLVLKYTFSKQNNQWKISTW
jgi:ARC6-like, IMS domain